MRKRGAGLLGYLGAFLRWSCHKTVHDKVHMVVLPSKATERAKGGSIQVYVSRRNRNRSRSEESLADQTRLVFDKVTLHNMGRLNSNCRDWSQGQWQRQRR
jgi:hypothetical protein